MSLNFKWYWAAGSSPDTFNGQCDTREQAIAEAEADDNCIERGFTIIEAAPAVVRFDCFDSERVLEELEEHNLECWGEDGMDLGGTDEQRKELEQMLSATLVAWLDKYGLKPAAWAFGETRNEEYFEPQSGDEADSAPEAVH